MKCFHRPFLAFLLSLLLLGAQQAAFAHLLSHAPGQAQAGAQYQDDDAALDSVVEICGSCIAFAGVGGATPPASTPFVAAPPADDGYLLPPAATVSARPLIFCRARAPPVVL